MELSTYEIWLEWSAQEWGRRAAADFQSVYRQQEYLQRQRERRQAIDRKRAELLKKFPFTVVAEGEHAEHDYAARWCWQQIGPQNGRCTNYHSTYPACPLVLATEYIQQEVRKDVLGQECLHTWKAYRDPGEHKHEGIWTSLWLGKSGHDYGFNVYFFLNENDKRRFLTAFPTFIWDASWDR